MAEVLRFKMLSSDGSRAYVIEASSTEAGVSLTCECEAGQKGSLCRHRLALVQEEPDGLVAGAENLEGLYALLEGSKLGDALLKLVDIEGDILALQSKLAVQKKTVARLMKGR